MKKSGFLMLCLLLLLSIPAFAAGEAYSFPWAGVRIEMWNDWLLVTTDTLSQSEDELTSHGIDLNLLRLDMQASGAVFTVFIGDVRVTLSRYENEQAAAWQSMEAMQESDKEALFDAFSASPYQNTGWAQGDAPYLAFDWVVQSGGEAMRFSGAAIVSDGALYQLTATSAAPFELLREANARALSTMSFFKASIPEETPQTFSAFVPIEDDGAAVPLDLVGFTGVSFEDTTELVIQTLPGAEVVVVTPNDKLRATVDESGQRTFRVSTRREMSYPYTISASMPDRTTSQVEIIVDRQLSPERRMDAFKRSARTLDSALYEQLLQNAADFAGTAAAVHGDVERFEEWQGFPCALVFIGAEDESKKPVFIALMEPFDLSEGGPYTIYAEILTETMLFENKDGVQTHAPLLRAQLVLQP